MRNKSQRREELRVRRHRRVRKKVVGTAARPRLVVHRSLKHMQGQITDDTTGKVLVGVTTAAPELKDLRGDPETTKRKLSEAAGRLLAERARAAGVTAVVFDRGGYLYHGRVAAFADGARKAGLEF